MRPLTLLCSRALRVALLIALLTAPAARGADSCVTTQPGAPYPEKQAGIPHGIQNFGQVTAALYRGAQPTHDGYRELKDLGVDIVVSFREEKGENGHERRAVEALGMRFVSIPWNAFHIPTDFQVREFFEVFRANPGKKIFVHCQQGRDRTGTMIAVYRITVERWCVESALSEMRAFHYHHFWFPQLERYVRGYTAPAASNAKLGGTAPAPQSSTP
jgi:protein tyrosine/serine phosphatase